MEARLILLDPPAARREVKLSLPATVGRSREAKFKLVHGQVSRVHCEFFERDGLLHVRDLGSTNGTFVGAERVSESAISPGDTVTIGAVKFQAEYEPSEGATLPATAISPTETLRKGGEATIRPQLSSAGAANLTDETSAHPTLPAAETTAPSSADSERNEQENSDWFDDLMADEPEAPANGEQLAPAEEASTEPTESTEGLLSQPRAVEWEELGLEPLDDELPAASAEPPSVAATTPPEDDSLDILPPQSDSEDIAEEPTAELTWRVPEPASPGASEFAFDLEQPSERPAESQSAPAAKSNPPKEPAKTEDEDLDQFLKSLDLD